MRQLLQSLNDGSLDLTEVPAPKARRGCVRVANLASVVSPGTEKLMMDLASKSLLGKARARPDLVHKVLDKVQRDGVLAAYRSVTAKLGEPAPIGYACAGRVIDTGAGAEDFPPGSLVACAGAGYANHAEQVVVPRNLIVPVPEGVSAEHAAFGTLGSIALQGVRILRPELGETVAVVGLGLLGLLSVQLLRAAGCKVLGTDPSPIRVDLAKKLGASEAWLLGQEDLSERFFDHSDGYGVDAVLIAASSKDNSPMALAGEITRDRGRVIVVGAVKTEFDRNIYYAKELEVRLSRSYGPGRYDPSFEERGIEYPRGYVRFTETENIRCFLELVASGRVDLAPLITHRFPFERALDAYELLSTGTEPSIGIVLTYSGVECAAPISARPTRKATSAKPGVSFVGAGSFARSVLLPAFSGKTRLRGVVTGRGFTAAGVAKSFNFEKTFDEAADVFADSETSLVVIATRHDSHAEMAAQALGAGKHVFVEKPLAIDTEGLLAVESAARENSGILHVGFNRRFAPMAIEMRRQRNGSDSPVVLTIRINAGAVPPGHWTTDAGEGGSRLLGEGCHFVDFARFIVGSEIQSVQASAIGSHKRDIATQNFAATLTFRDGSVANLVYTSLGDSKYPKERYELFSGGRVAVIDDFSRMTVTAAGKTRSKRSINKDKGHAAQVAALLRVLANGGQPPIPPSEILEVSWATLALATALQTGCRVELAAFRQDGRDHLTP